MKVFKIFVLLAIPVLTFSQVKRSQVTIFKSASLSSSPLFSSEAKFIEFNLMERVLDGKDTSFFVAVSVKNIGEKKVGSTTGSSVNSNLQVTLGGSSITQVYRNEGHIELDKNEFHEVFDFINSSMRKANPIQELQTAYSLSVSEKLGVSLIFDGDEWSYLFRLDDAQYKVEFQASIDIILELKEIDEYFQKNL